MTACHRDQVLADSPTPMILQMRTDSSPRGQKDPNERSCKSHDNTVGSHGEHTFAKTAQSTCAR